jgi:hypothetical protein
MRLHGFLLYSSKSWDVSQVPSSWSLLLMQPCFRIIFVPSEATKLQSKTVNFIINQKIKILQPLFQVTTSCHFKMWWNLSPRNKIYRSCPLTLPFHHYSFFPSLTMDLKTCWTAMLTSTVQALDNIQAQNQRRPKKRRPGTYAPRFNLSFSYAFVRRAY